MIDFTVGDGAITSCGEGLTLVYKVSDSLPVCVRLHTAEKLVLLKIQSNSTMTKKEQSDHVMGVRNQYKLSMGKILDDKIGALDELRKEMDTKVQSIAKEYENNPEIKIVWNSDVSSYETIENP